MKIFEKKSIVVTGTPGEIASFKHFVANQNACLVSSVVAENVIEVTPANDTVADHEWVDFIQSAKTFY